MPRKSSATTERRWAASDSLLGEGVPEANSNVVVVRSSRIVFVIRIHAVKKVRREVGARWQERSFDLNARSELYSIRPVLSFCILGEIRIQQKLDRRTLSEPKGAAR